MLGAIIGDIAGSRFEWDNHRSKEFELFTEKCQFTDDSVMTLAICEALADDADDIPTLSEKAVYYMQKLGRKYPNAGYGARFAWWLMKTNPEPYGSWGNGAAMRVSGCGFAAKSIEQAKEYSRAVTEVTHNHPEGLKGAESVACAIYMAKTGSSLDEIRDFVLNNYYNIDFTLDEIRDTYSFDESSQGTVPQAFEAFFESTSFEDAIRNAISIGGDSDTIAAITGGIAEAYYGIPEEIRKKAMKFLDKELRDAVERFEGKVEK